MDGILLKRDSNRVLLRYINIDHTNKLLKEFHDDPASGHFLARITTTKIMRVGYYWSTLFNDFHKWVRKFVKNFLSFLESKD